jgi:Voltage-dependent anion channel
LTTAAAGALGLFSQQRQILTTGTLVIWCLAMAWLFPLVSCEILRPRLRYDVRRWATVFPLGTYAACSFAVGQEEPAERPGRALSRSGSNVSLTLVPGGVRARRR